MSTTLIDDALLGLYLSLRAPEALSERVADAPPIIPSSWLFRLCRVLVNDGSSGAIRRIVREELDQVAYARLMAVLADPPSYLVDVRSFGANALHCAELAAAHSLSMAAAEALFIAVETNAVVLLHATQNEPKLVAAATAVGVTVQIIEVD